MAEKSMTLVEIDYKLVPKFKGRRTQAQRRFKSKRQVTRTVVLVIDRAGLSKETVETALKRIFRRALIKNSIKLVAYRTVESEDGNGAQNSAN